MLFNFTLTPVDELVSPARDRHWFDLSEGCYWLRLGKAEVFRFAQGVHGGGASPYVLYYVGRLWEDLLELLPVIAEPIPDQLAERLATFDDWLGSIERLKAWAGQHEDSDPAWTIWSEATDWFFAVGIHEVGTASA